MPSVLIYVEQQPDGRIRKGSLNAIEAGKQLAQKVSGALHLIVVGKAVGPVVDEVKTLGAATVHSVDAELYAHLLAESVAPVIAELATKIGAEYVGAASTAVGKDTLPRVAAKLKGAMASDILKIEGSGADVTFVRPMWAGKVIAEVKLTTKVKLFTVRTTEFPAATASGSAATVETFAPGAAISPTTFVDFKEVKSARPELTEARVVVSGGRGTKGDFKEVEAMADALRGAVGASRAVCDAGWVPNDLQVGQTGKVVAPQLYIAAGISGAIQHIAGMKSSKTIVAINTNREAPIFEVADYGLVEDLFKALPALRAALGSGK